MSNHEVTVLLGLFYFSEEFFYKQV